MRGKYEKVLAKMYMSSQDEVIEGLAPNILERGETNVLTRGHQQDFQMSSPMRRYNNDISELVNDDSFTHQNLKDRNDYRTQATSDKDQTYLNNKRWAEELTKADERSHIFL